MEKFEPGLDDALIVVDVQNDFCPGGALGVNEGDAVVPIVNRLVPLFQTRVFSRDWHPENHCSFARLPKFVDCSWPVHCVQDTHGAAYHPDLEVPDDAIEVFKGTDPDREAYSAFQDTGLAGRLKSAGVKRVFLVGLATDYCVRCTALDALKAGFRTLYVSDGCRGVDVPSGTAAKAEEEMLAAGAEKIASEQIAGAA